MFPEAAPADHKRAARICRERAEMPLEKLKAAAEAFTDKWYKDLIAYEPKMRDRLIDQYMRSTRHPRWMPNLENLFPKPNKSKS